MMNNNSLTLNNLCRFCNAELTALGDCYVCEQCKTVARIGSVDNETISSNVKATIESIQQYLDCKAKYLHDIEQKYINHVKLNDKEKAIHKYCLDFQDCKDCLQSFMKGRLDFNDIDFRQKLYKLLELSLEFKKVFGTSCVEFEL